MRNVRPAFEVFEGTKDQLPIGYQFMKCHMIFDVKFGENFRCKARLVAGGHMTETPATLTYSSVASRDSLWIALTIAALNVGIPQVSFPMCTLEIPQKIAVQVLLLLTLFTFTFESFLKL